MELLVLFVVQAVLVNLGQRVFAEVLVQGFGLSVMGEGLGVLQVMRGTLGEALGFQRL
jgi:hypothetical protein